MKKINLLNFTLALPILTVPLSEAINQDKINDNKVQKNNEEIKKDNLKIDPKITLNKNKPNFILPIEIKDFNLPSNINSFKINDLKFKFTTEYDNFIFWQKYGENKSNKISKIDLEKVNRMMMQNKTLNFQIKSTNKWININTTAEFINLPSTITKQSITQISLANYEIKNIEIEIDYQYKENDSLQNDFEEKVNEFFEQSYDLNLNNVNNGHDVLNEVRDYLEYYLKDANDINWSIDLAYHNHEQLLESKNEKWDFAIKVNNKMIKPRKNGKYFSLKIIDIEIYSPLVRKIYLYLKNINWKIDYKITLNSNNEIEDINLLDIFSKIIKDNVFPEEKIEEIKNIIDNNFYFEKSKFQKRNRLNIDVFLKEKPFMIGTLSITNIKDIEE